MVMLSNCDTFQRAYDLAVARVGSGWATLSPRAQVDAIYHEMRWLDAERAGVTIRYSPSRRPHYMPVAQLASG